MRSGSWVRVILFLLLLSAARELRGQAGTATITVAVNGSDFDVSVYLQRSGPAWNLGYATFAFDYNTTAMTFTAKLADGIWDNNASASYGDLLANPYGSTAYGLDVDYPGSGVGTAVPTSPALVGTLRFTVSNPAAMHNILWRTDYSAVFDIAGTPMGIAFIDPLNGPLPIQLASFTATSVQGNMVELAWTTLSETGNYGFEVEKSMAMTSGFQAVPSSFVPGHGTTTERHDYRFTDVTGTPARYYRLKQIGTDASVQYSEPVEVTGTTGVNDRAPMRFTLMQNFPNPFNPSTTIRYAVAERSPVTMRVYNLLGEEVALLVNTVQGPGDYEVQFDGSRLASGAYICRLQAGELLATTRLLLLK